MTRPAIAFVVDGNVVRKKECEWDGTSLIEKKRRRKYLVKSAPLLMTDKGALGVGSKAVNVFFVSTETATSFDPTDKALKKITAEDLRVMGVTVEPPHGTTIIEEKAQDGSVMRRYTVTPENIFEQSDSADLKALNLAQGLPVMLLWMAAGAGAAGMVLIYFLFTLFKGTSFFGGGG